MSRARPMFAAAVTVAAAAGVAPPAMDLDARARAIVHTQLNRTLKVKPKPKAGDKASATADAPSEATREFLADCVQVLTGLFHTADPPLQGAILRALLNAGLAQHINRPWFPGGRTPLCWAVCNSVGLLEQLLALPVPTPTPAAQTDAAQAAASATAAGSGAGAAEATAIPAPAAVYVDPDVCSGDHNACAAFYGIAKGTLFGARGYLDALIALIDRTSDTALRASVVSPPNAMLPTLRACNSPLHTALIAHSAALRRAIPTPQGSRGRVPVRSTVPAPCTALDRLITALLARADADLSGCGGCDVLALLHRSVGGPVPQPGGRGDAIPVVSHTPLQQFDALDDATTLARQPVLLQWNAQLRTRLAAADDRARTYRAAFGVCVTEALQPAGALSGVAALHAVIVSYLTAPVVPVPWPTKPSSS